MVSTWAQDPVLFDIKLRSASQHATSVQTHTNTWACTDVAAIIDSVLKDVDQIVAVVHDVNVAGTING